MSDKRWMTTTAGVLDILAAVSALVGLFFLVFAVCMLGWAAHHEGADVPMVPMQLLFGGIGLYLSLVFLVALAGGIAALRRGSWGWALAGSIAATLTCVPFGLPALILTVVAEDELRGA
ncbi:MAG: hypothetical protein R2991_12755 [Thermoanaerobaculia bacterium]